MSSKVVWAVLGTMLALLIANTVPVSAPTPGDIDGIPGVDMGDLVIVCVAFGSEAVDDPATPWDDTTDLGVWNPIADINGDNKVDIGDIVIVAINFGKP